MSVDLAAEVVATKWPELSTTEEVAVIAYPIVTFVLFYVWLRIVWPPSDATRDPPNPDTGKTRKQEKEEEAKAKDTEMQHANASTALNASKQKNYSTNDDSEGSRKALEAGDASGSYDKVVFWESFDAVFLGIMVAFFVINAAATTFLFPELWSNTHFWLLQLPKLGGMMLVSVCGGILCSMYTDHDEAGYCITRIDPKTGKKSKFRVNYTRKLQHFAAYAIPLVIKSDVVGTIALCWGDFFTLLGFLILIKPLREMKNPIGKFLMFQFNSLDRPEDRPNTIKWIVGGNILPGLAMIIFFRHFYALTGQQSFSFIWVFITGIGDGLAEPVGITWGEHKYYTKSLASGQKKNPYYMRSYEGSACVWLSSCIFTAMFWYVFQNAYAFWLCMFVMPPLMTIAEATSPHTMDTPFLMGLGGLLCLLCSWIPSNPLG